jgi:hypothetical protein
MLFDQNNSRIIPSFYDAQEDTSIGVVLLSAEGPSKTEYTHFVAVEIKMLASIKVT